MGVRPTHAEEDRVIMLDWRVWLVMSVWFIFLAFVAIFQTHNPVWAVFDILAGGAYAFLAGYTKGFEE